MVRPGADGLRAPSTALPVTGGNACLEADRTHREALLRRLLADVDAVAARALATLQAELAPFADPDAAFAEDVLEQLRRNYAALLSSLIDGTEPTTDELAFQRGASMRRARTGFALDEYLSASRVAQRVLWESIVERADDDDVDDRAVLTLATELMRFADRATRHAGRVYVESCRHGLTALVEERSDLLELLLAGSLPPKGPLAAAANRYGLGPRTPALVAVAVPLGGANGHDLAQLASATLAQVGLYEPTALVAVRGEETVAIVGLGGELDAERLCQRLERACELLRRDANPFAMAISTVTTGMEELRRGYREATASLRFVGADGGVAALPRMSPLQYLLLGADDTARRLIDRRVAGFLEEDQRRGGMLVSTLRAYAGNDLSIKNMAEQLHIHSNTAQYRLRRVAELSGLNPRRFDELHRLLVAIAVYDATTGQIGTPTGELSGYEPDRSLGAPSAQW